MKNPRSLVFWTRDIEVRVLHYVSENRECSLVSLLFILHPIAFLDIYSYLSDSSILSFLSSPQGCMLPIPFIKQLPSTYVKQG